MLALALAGALVAGVSSREMLLPRHTRPDRHRGARWARRRDLRPLLVDGRDRAPGRLVLGVVPGTVRARTLAVEPTQSLVVVGPTQSGKTTSLAVPAILDWRGPVVAASVKSDLLRDTLARRRSRGRVWCVDPTGATGVPPSTWSPLSGCADWRRAVRTAADLCETARSDGTTPDGEFWYATAAKLLAPVLFAAARDGRTMADVVRWVDTQEAGEVADALERAGVPEALDAAQRQLGSRRTNPQLGLHDGGDGARALRRGASGSDHGRAIRTPAPARRISHPLPVRTGARPATPARVLQRARGAGALALLLDRHPRRAPARSSTPGGARRGRPHRATARARRVGRDVRLPRDPAGDGVAGPGPGPKPLRPPCGDGAQQPSGQALPAGHRRPGHPRLRQPPGRRRGNDAALGDTRRQGWTLDHVGDGTTAAPAPRGAALPPARVGRARLRDPPPGQARAPAVVGAIESLGRRSDWRQESAQRARNAGRSGASAVDRRTRARTPSSARRTE